MTLTVFSPLYTYPSEQSIEQGLYRRGERQPNLAPEFTAELGLRFVADGEGDLTETFGPVGLRCAGYMASGQGRRVEAHQRRGNRIRIWIQGRKFCFSCHFLPFCANPAYHLGSCD